MIIGGGAVFLFFVFYALVRPDFSFSLQQITGLILIFSLISGAVAAGGIFLDEFLVRQGITNNKIRQLVIFLLSIFVVGGVSFIVSLYFNSFEFEPLLLFCGLGGIVVAAVAMIVDYNIWKMRKKVLALEMENKYLEEIAEKERLLEETRKDLIVTQERNRIARDLHDSISQGLQGIKYSIQTLRQKIINIDELAGTETIIEHLEETTGETLKELRNMVFALKPVNKEEKGLSRALRIHCELFAERQGINLNINIDDVEKLNPEQELAVYRVVQESLTNVQKHSGTDNVSVVLKEYDDKVKLVIEDDGKGFSVDNARGNGLNNMRTRVFQNNGKFNISSEEGKGTLIQAEFNIMN